MSRAISSKLQMLAAALAPLSSIGGMFLIRGMGWDKPALLENPGQYAELCLPIAGFAVAASIVAAGVSAWRHRKVMR